MNCKPGELAMIVRNTMRWGCLQHVIGSPIKVTQISVPDVCGFGPAWRYSGPFLRCPNCNSPLFGILDADLQPLRPPALETETVYEVIEEASHPKPQVEFAR
jgi:hypothetical protein